MRKETGHSTGVDVVGVRRVSRWLEMKQSKTEQ